jgi:hypothetical protein
MKESPAREVSQSTEIARIDPQALIEKAVTSGANIETLERLLALAKDVRQIQAREAWLHAMAIFQETCPPILRSGKARISTKSGASFGYSYAPLAEILSTVQPVMGPLGLSVSFRVRLEKENVIALCIVSHEMGHHEDSGEIAIPISFGDGTGASAAQHVGIAATYAKRYALLAIIGIAPEEDADAKVDQQRPTVEMPRRSSEANQTAPPADAKPINYWTGKILDVKTKTGERNGNKWTLYTIQTKDAQEFATFDEKHATFAREAGSSPVTIGWEKTERGMKAVSIRPPDEGPDA